MSSIARRAATKLVRIIARAADPPTESGRALTYSKLVNGVAQLFGRSSGGIVHQLTGPGAIIPTKYVDGMACAWVAVGQVSVAAGRARSDDDTFDIVLAALVTANIANVGVVNGLDAGAEAASTWYAIWAIGDSTGVNPAGSLLSASFSAPTLPAGYDKKRRVGVVRNSSGSDFLRFFQRWNSRTRRYWYDEARATLQVLTNGAQLAYTAVPCATRVPPSSQNAIFGVDFIAPTVGGVQSDQLEIRITGGNATTGPYVYRAGQTAGASLLLDGEMIVSAAQSIDYKVSDADDLANLFVLGFDDEI